MRAISRIVYLSLAVVATAAQASGVSGDLIGLTLLPERGFNSHAAVEGETAVLLDARTGEMHVIHAELLAAPFSVTQFVGWLPDRTRVLIHRGVVPDGEFCASTVANRTFYDLYVCDLVRKVASSPSRVARVGRSNLFQGFQKSNGQVTGFALLVQEPSEWGKVEREIYFSDLSGLRKTPGSSSPVHGCSPSLDGRLYVCGDDVHTLYVKTALAGGTTIDTITVSGFPFAPAWSPTALDLFFFDCDQNPGPCRGRIAHYRETPGGWVKSYEDLWLPLPRTI